MIKKCIIATIVFFLVINIIAYFHAYKFTHLTQYHSGAQQTNSNIKGVIKKIYILLTGVKNFKTPNNKKPTDEYQHIRIKSDNKYIDGWLIEKSESKGTIILFHGYTSNKSSMLNQAKIFKKMGFTTLLIDFSGNGDSEGNQTTIGFQESKNVKNAYKYIEQKGEKNIILYGVSMGAVAIMRAQSIYQLKTKGIILECPFGTMLDTVKARFKLLNIPAFPMAWLLTFWGGAQNGFNAFEHNPIEYAKNIQSPSLILYGGEDKKVSLKEIQDIYHNIPGIKKLKIYPNAGHENYTEKYGEERESDINVFLDSLYDT